MGLETVEGVADSDFLDRLAERVYEIGQFVDPLLGLNDDGSLSVSFEVPAATALDAIEAGLDLFFRAFVEAEPLRAPTRAESESGAHLVRVAGESARQLSRSMRVEPAGRSDEQARQPGREPVRA